MGKEGKEGGVGLCSPGGPIDGGMSPLTCLSRDDECDSVCAHV